MACRIVLLVVFLGSPVAAQSPDELRVDHVMYDDPELRPAGSRQVFDPRLKGLWVMALQRPESELQRMAADTIAMAHKRGMPDLGSTAVELLKIVQRPESDATVRRAAAHALVVLQAKEHAPALAKVASQYGFQLQLVIEPALASWKEASLRATWRQRISEAHGVPRLQLMAIEGLRALHDVESKPALLAIVRNAQAPMDQRWAAARAVASVSDSGLLEDANRFLADKSPAGIPNRLVGVALLTAHRDEAALKRMTELAEDSEPSIAAVALERLWEWDPKFVIPLAPRAIKSSDVNVRRFGARALFVQGDVLAIETSAPLLDDPNPSLRRMVAKGFAELSAKPELRAAVVVACEKYLSQPSWRGLEQAALLVGTLKHAPAAPRLIELLPNPRDEVAVTAAWSLRQLKVPESLPPILEHVKRVHPLHIGLTTPVHEIERHSVQLTQLFELFGEVRWPESEPMLRNYIPKVAGLGDSRTAACWALGRIHEGKVVEDLVKKFEERLEDVASLMPEFDPVRMMCALGLGRMKSESSLPSLRQFSTEASDQVSLACWWSIQRMTGEKPPDWKPSVRMASGWFLTPLDP